MNQEPVKKNSGKKILFWIFIVILLGINGAQFYLQQKTEKEHIAVVEEKDYRIAKAEQRIDSLAVEIQKRITELEKLGVFNDSLKVALDEMTALKEQFRKEKGAGWAKYNQIKSQIDGYGDMLKQKDDEIVKLKAESEELFKEVTNLKQEKVVLNDTISNLKNTNTDLSNKVEIASKLKAENFEVKMYNSKGKEYTKQPFKGSKAEKIVISFNFMKNEIAEKGARDVMIIIKEPNSSVNYQKGTDASSYDGKGLNVMKKTFTFSNSEKPQTVDFSKSEFADGTYEVKVYIDEEVIGSTSFSTK